MIEFKTHTSTSVDIPYKSMGDKSIRLQQTQTSFGAAVSVQVICLTIEQAQDLLDTLNHILSWKR